MAKAQPNKWKWLRGKYPELPEEPQHADVVAAMQATHRGKRLEELAARLNELESIKEIQQTYVSKTNAEITAVERLMVQAFDDAGVDGIVVGGFSYAPKTEACPKIEDPVAWRAWVDEQMPELLSVNASTRDALVRRCLDAGEAIPPGIGIEVYNGVARRKK